MHILRQPFYLPRGRVQFCNLYVLENEIIFVTINLTELPGANNTWDQAERLAWLFYFNEIVPTVSAQSEEQCIIDNLQKFLMERGKRYAFVARQQHIHTDKEDYSIDLVF